MKVGTVKAIRDVFTHVLVPGVKTTHAFWPSEIVPELRGTLRVGDRVEMEARDGTWVIVRKV